MANARFRVVFLQRKLEFWGSPASPNFIEGGSIRGPQGFQTDLPIAPFEACVRVLNPPDKGSGLLIPLIKDLGLCPNVGAPEVVFLLVFL